MIVDVFPRVVLWTEKAMGEIDGDDIILPRHWLMPMHMMWLWCFGKDDPLQEWAAEIDAMRALARRSCHRQHKSQTDDNDSDDNSQQSTNNQQSAAATSLTAPPTATPPQTPLSEPQLKSESEADARSWQRLESRASEWGRRLFSLPYLIFACCFRWGSIRLLCTVPSKRRDWFRFGRAGCGLSMLIPFLHL